jgi:aspartyl/glutamyl-tRNA(Asn/Gln) amidotransferase C subunit
MANLQNQLNNSIKLAHLSLDSGEKKKLLSDLEEILGFVQIIKKAEEKGDEVFGKDIAPENREFPQTEKRNTLREDVIEPFDNVRGIIDEIPQKKENLIKVKKI